MYEIPDCFPKELRDIEDEFKLMIKYKRKGIFAFVSWKWVNPFVKWIGNRKCLEVMAGRGILSYALRKKGVQIISTDDYSWFGDKLFTKWNNTFIIGGDFNLIIQ